MFTPAKSYHTFPTNSSICIHCLTHILPCVALLCFVNVPCFAILRPLHITCPAMFCLPHHTLPCHVLPYPNVPCPALPHFAHTPPYPALPRSSLPCHILPYPALLCPCPTHPWPARERISCPARCSWASAGCCLLKENKEYIETNYNGNVNLKYSRDILITSWHVKPHSIRTGCLQDISRLCQ